MRNFLTAFLTFLLWSFFALWFHQTQSKKTCGDCAIAHTITTNDNNSLEPEKTKITTPKIKKATTTPITKYKGFVVFDKFNNPVYQFPEGFISNSANGNVVIPKSLISFKDSIYTFLNTHQQKEVIINAAYLNSEFNSDGTNFGDQRGNQIKNMLTQFGVNPDKISVESVLSNYSYNSNNNTYNKGISMLFRNLSADRISAIENNVANKTLYSYFAQKSFKPDRTLKAYTIELKNYLEKYPTKRVLITGHTDAVGSSEANDWFGAERAKNVVKYFVRQGIDKTKFTVQSKGHTVPIATNATSEGRAKNRRIEIKIQ